LLFAQVLYAGARRSRRSREIPFREYRERASLLRSAAERLNTEGKRHLLNIVEEFERFAQSTEQARFE
jgi:hypothetical protein